MPASIRLPPELQEQLRSHAKRQQVSASDVVREALTQYLDAHAESPYEQGKAVFGRFRSSDGISQRSTERKAIVRERVQRKHPRE